MSTMHSSRYNSCFLAPLISFKEFDLGLDAYTRFTKIRFINS